MRSRLVVAAMFAGVLGGCYDVPQPDCGFTCGDERSCPSGYECLGDHICHVVGAAPVFCENLGGGDHVAPQVVASSLIPQRGDTNVPADANVQFVIDEPLLASTINGATFRLVNTETGEVIQAFLDALETTEQTMQMGLRPTTDLIAGQTYEVQLGGDITDYARNHLFPYVWRFTIDTTPPSVVAFTPSNGATNVKVNVSDPLVEFSERMTNITSANFRLMIGATSVPSLISFATGNAIATIDPTDQLLPFTVYTIRLDEPITDISLNRLPAQTSMFQTGADDVPPNASVILPSLQTGAPVNTLVGVRFDEPVTNVTETSFTLAAMDGTPVPATTTYDPVGHIARLDPIYQLAPLAQYRYTLAAPMADASGNAVAFTSTFTTAIDAVGPRLVTTLPRGGAVDVPVATTIAMTFDEPVQNVADNIAVFATIAGTPTEVPGALAASDQDRVWTFTPASPLPVDTRITIELQDGITDKTSPPNGFSSVSYAFRTVM